MPIRTMEELRDVMYAFRMSRIISTALDLDIFTKMGTRWWTTKDLAKFYQSLDVQAHLFLDSLSSQ